MTEPTKVKFKKNKDGKVHLSAGYYSNEQDFKDRNCTLFFVEITSIVKPPMVKKAS